MEEEAGEHEPIYLELADAVELYGLIIGASAVQAADQLRDPAGLDGALARPQLYAHYEAADLALQASVATLAASRARRVALAATITRRIADPGRRGGAPRPPAPAPA